MELQSERRIVRSLQLNELAVGGIIPMFRRRRLPRDEAAGECQGQLLCEAVAERDADLVDTLLQQGADPRTVRAPGGGFVCRNCPGQSCPGALHRVWSFGLSLTPKAPDGGEVAPLLRIFSSLIRAGASVDAPNPAGESVQGLVEACAEAGNAVAADVLATVAQLRAEGEAAGTELLQAAEQGESARVAELLRDPELNQLRGRGAPPLAETATVRADPNFRDQDGLSALHWALVRGHVNAAEALLANGADPNLTDEWGLAAAHAPFADSAGRAAALKGEDDKGMHPLSHEKRLHAVRLHAVLELLIEYGVDLNAKDAFGGGTILHYALEDTAIETAEGLILNGAKGDIADAQGKTALEILAGHPAGRKLTDVMKRTAAAAADAERDPEGCVPFPTVRAAKEATDKAEGKPAAAKAASASQSSAQQALFGGRAKLSRQASSTSSRQRDSDEESEGKTHDHCWHLGCILPRVPTTIVRTGSDLFDGFDDVLTQPWEELSAEQQEAAKVLGWDRARWGDAAKYSLRMVGRNFSELTAEEEEACGELEIDEDDWDDMEVFREAAEPEPEPEPEEAAAGGSAPLASSASAGADRLMSDAALARYRSQTVEEVSSLLSTSQHVATCLLSKHHWDSGAIRSQCADKWFGDGRVGLLESIGVSAGQEEEKPQPAGQERVECYVCFEDKLPSEVSQNRCGHVFCNDCWALHLAETIGDGTLHPPCMDTTCKVAVSENMIRKLAPASALDKFQRFSLAQMIEEHGLLKKCRTP